ncbi:Elicitor-responsive protein 1 [Acorus gramineus]|uniref:Elicitor-responsive protein 1 n=1 Tax=Acorus gramineus TaxID=55184 RepID=A0AAV9B2B7_ACOGR|nr:Elicitor-responsive protein 1 [Acorus gramineus]
MDKDTFTADDFVGESTINVTEIVALGAEKGKMVLPPQKYNVVLADQTYHGEIRVGFTFTAKA